MEDYEYYIMCGVILTITVIVIMTISIVLKVTNPDRILKNEKTTTTRVIKTNTTQPKENYGSITVSNSAINNNTTTKNITFENAEEENLYIAKNGIKEITLSAKEPVTWIVKQKDKNTNNCILYKDNNNNSMKITSNNCVNEDYIEVTAKSNNREKTYKITNEKELTLSMDGTIIKDNTPLHNDLIELTSNINVNWSISDESAIIYTDLSSYILKFKLNKSVTINARTKANQIKVINMSLKNN